MRDQRENKIEFPQIALINADFIYEPVHASSGFR